MRRAVGAGTLLGLCAVALGVAAGSARAGAARSISADPRAVDQAAWTFPVAVDDAAGALAPEAPTLIADAAGTLHAAWIDYRAGPTAPGILYASRPPGGAWSTNEEAVPARWGAAVESPRLAVDAMGNVHLVWVESGASGADIYVAHRVATGRVWGPPQRVNDEIGSARQGEPAVAGDLWGSVDVVWTDSRGGSPDIYFSRIPAGKSPGRNVRVNSTSEGEQTAPTMVLSGAGTLHAAWVDTREGRADIYASQLPHSGLAPEIGAAEIVWWPDARLDYAPNGLRQGAPSLAAGLNDVVRAVWTEGDDRLRAADLLPDSPYWQIDRVVYRAPGGAVIRAPQAAMDPAGTTEVVWTEEAGGRSHVWSGRLEELALADVTGVDEAPLTAHGAAAALAVDPFSVAHALWVGTTRFGDVHVYHATKALPAPSYPQVTYEGFLTYAQDRMSCPGDGFLIVDCAGTTGPWVVAQSVEPTFIGRYVTAKGYLVEGTACPMMRATSVTLGTSPCPRGTGSLTGVITAGGAPLAGATVRVAERETTTGSSGRFAMDGLDAGVLDVKVTAPCSLDAELPGVRVESGFTRALTPATLIRADVQPDCVVDLMDLVRVTLRYKEPPPYPACTDLDRDGVVSIFDVAAVSGAYGSACPMPWAAGTGSATEAAGRASPPEASRAAGEGLALVVDDPLDLEAWEVSLVYDPLGFAPGDRSSAPGTQPFVIPPGSEALRNAALAGGRLEVAGRRLRPDRRAAPLVLATLPGADAGAVRLASAHLADARGAPSRAAGVRVVPVQFLFLPRLVAR